MTIDIGKTEAEHALWAEKLYHAADTDFDLGADGVVSRDGLALGKLTRGADALTPDVAIFIDEAVGADIRDKIHRRLGHFIERKIAMHFAPLLALRDDETLKTPEHANGAYLAKRLVEALGVVPRGFLRRTIKEMDQDARTPLRKCGVRFGQYMIYLPLLLKPAPTQLRLVLWAVFEGFADFPIVPSAGLVTIPALKDMPSGYHWRAGYQELGDWAVRIDMLERLANMIRECDVKEGFESHCDMLSITGASLETFAAMMQELGYSADRHTRMKTAVAEVAGDDAAEAVEEVRRLRRLNLRRPRLNLWRPKLIHPSRPRPNPLPPSLTKKFIIFSNANPLRGQSPLKPIRPPNLRLTSSKAIRAKVLDARFLPIKTIRAKMLVAKNPTVLAKTTKPPHKQPIDPDNPFAQLKALKLTMND